jgi:phosphorylase kinase alpha/beta subunit
MVTGGYSFVPLFSFFLYRTESESAFEHTELDELLSMLRETDILEEQGDILHYLVLTHGLEYSTGTLLILLGSPS